MTFDVRPRSQYKGLPSTFENVLDSIMTDVIISGMTVSTVSGLTVAVATGIAFLKGYYVNITAAENITLAASSTNYVYVQLKRNAQGEVNTVTGPSAQITSNTTGTAPADSILVAKVVTGVSTVTTITAQRALTSTDDMIYLKQQGSTPADPEITTDTIVYTKNVDANNQGIFAKIKVDGAIREVRFA